MKIIRPYLFAPIFFILCSLSILDTQAQSRSIQGQVLSESKMVPLYLAQVLVINRKDSTLIAFQRSSETGYFHFHVPDSIRCFIQISFPNSFIYVDTIPNLPNDIDLGKIKIVDDYKDLKAAIIKGYTDGVKLKGDTTEYLADFFKTNPGATVEDLLKKLPGIQINKNGEITAQGKKVNKILVDGEEFFSDDPGIATKYLRADMIDRVQVYDENKDTLKGRTGEESRTMNLTMKDGKNKGVFGKLEAGSNFDQYHNGGAFAGYFNQKIKSAVYGKTSTFENSALKWDERSQFGSNASGGEVVNYGMYSYSSYSNSYDDQLDTKGIPSNTSAGASLNYKINNHLKINSSYRYSNEGLKGTTVRNSNYYLPDTSYSLKDTNNNQYNQVGQRINVSLSGNIDSLSTLNISASAGHNTGSSESAAQSATRAARNINDNSKELNKAYTRDLYQFTVGFSRIFKKPGRSLGANANIDYKPSVNSQTLAANTRFYNEAGNIHSQITTQQLTETKTANNAAGFSLSYAEPLSKKTTLTASYNAVFNSNQNTTNTYNTLSVQEKIDSLSNAFLYLNNTNKLSLSLNIKLHKISIWSTLGGGISNYKQDNQSTQINSSQRFVNILPNAGINYAWKKQSSIQLSYSGSNQAPSMSALQPLVNNSDLLNRVVGNPNLTQSFNHNFYTLINSYQTLKGRYLWGYLSFSLPQNAFVNSIQIDSTGVRRSMTVNANGNYNINSNFDYTFKLKKLPLYIGFSGNYQRSRTVSYNNGQRIETISSNPGVSADFSLSTDAIEFDIEYSLNYNTNQSGLIGFGKKSYFIHTPSYSIELMLPKNFSIETSGDLNIRPASALFSSQRNVFYLSAEMVKKFTKKNNFEISFKINDILNQNIGFNRYIGSNLVTEEVYTQLSRYWLIKLRWNFANAGGNS